MKTLIFTAMASFTPMKEAPKPKEYVKMYVAYDRKRTKVVKCILDKNGNQVDVYYKGLVILIDEDFCAEKAIFN